MPPRLFMRSIWWSNPSSCRDETLQWPELERPERRPQHDDGGERDQRAYDAHDHDVEVAFLVRAAAHGEERHHRAIVRKAVEGAGADHSYPVHQRWIDVEARSHLHKGTAERLERDREAAGGRAGERRQDVGGHRERHQRSATDSEHPVADYSAC